MAKKQKNEIFFYKLLIAILTVIIFILIFFEPSQYQQNKYVEIYTSNVIERKKLLHRYDINNLFFALQVVEANCPFRVRLGVMTDGGKWICNPMILKNSKMCTVYSFGLNGESSFEFDLKNVTESRCKIRAIDMNIPPNFESLKTIADVFITKVSAKTNTTTKSTSFTDIMHHFGDNAIEILKMDIEGAEFEIIDQILVVPICQISMEIHSEDVSKIVALLEKISHHGFYLFSVEQNPYVKHLIEYSFIHDSCMEKYGSFMLAKYLS